MSKSDRLFLVVFCAGVFTLAMMWYFFHPNSPYIDRTVYRVIFEEVGTLSPGDPVRVNGLVKGKVRDLTLKDEGVLVELDLRSEVLLPMDSDIRIINSGLMGQRIVEFSMGKSNEKLSPSKVHHGGYDYGSTRMAYQAKNLLESGDSLLKAVKGFHQEFIADPEMAQRFQKMKRKLLKIERKSRSTLTAIDSVEAIAADVQTIQSNMKLMVADIEQGIDRSKENVQKMQDKFGDFSEKFEKMGKTLDWLLERLDSDDNTVGLMAEEKEFLLKGKKLFRKGENFYRDLSEKGLDLNVDIF